MFVPDEIFVTIDFLHGAAEAEEFCREAGIKPQTSSGVSVTLDGPHIGKAMATAAQWVAGGRDVTVVQSTAMRLVGESE